MKQELILSNLGHTWIFDIDGTIVKHNRYKTDGKDEFLVGAKEFLSSIPESDMVIFITSRSTDYREQTENFLHENGVHYDHIIYDAPYGERILINDNKPSGLKMAEAVCLNRDQGMDFKYSISSDL